MFNISCWVFGSMYTVCSAQCATQCIGWWIKHVLNLQVQTCDQQYGCPNKNRWNSKHLRNIQKDMSQKKGVCPTISYISWASSWIWSQQVVAVKPAFSHRTFETVAFGHRVAAYASLLRSWGPRGRNPGRFCTNEVDGWNLMDVLYGKIDLNAHFQSSKLQSQHFNVATGEWQKKCSRRETAFVRVSCVYSILWGRKSPCCFFWYFLEQDVYCLSTLSPAKGSELATKSFCDGNSNSSCAEPSGTDDPMMWLVCAFFGGYINSTVTFTFLLGTSAIILLHSEISSKSYTYSHSKHIYLLTFS